MSKKPTQTKYYLIPADQPLPDGEHTICTMAGQEWMVDEAAITDFEISETEAKQLTLARMDEALHQVKGATVDVLGMAAQEAKKQEAAQSAQPTRPPSKLVTDALGFTPDEARQNPALAKEKLGQLFENVTQVLNGAVSDDPQAQEIAQQRMNTLRHWLAEQGIETNETMEQIPDKLRERFAEQTDPTQHQKRTDRLADLTGQLGQAFTKFGQEIQAEAAARKEQFAQSASNENL